MSTLSDFISHIKKNSIARVNRFRINFAIPSKLESLAADSGATKIMSLTCLMADIPGRQEQTTVVAYGNYGRKVTFTRSTNDFNTTFLITGNYIEKKFFDAWHNIICDESQTAVEFYDNYIANVYVECLNEQDEVVYSFELLEAYPAAISSVRLDRTAQNQQMVMDVNWAYFRIAFGPDQNNLMRLPGVGEQVPPVAVPTVGASKQRILEVPGIDTFSASVQNTMNTVKEFRGQLTGILNVARDVREQVRDAKMAAVDGVKVLNGVIKDIKAIANIPTDVKNEVIAVVTDTRNQIGYLKNDIKNISNYPER